MIKITKPYIGISEYINVMRVLASGNMASGRYVDILEKEFVRRFNLGYAMAVSNGTTALHLALLACGVGDGDEVVTTPFTFIATANSIIMCGATPVFVDIDANTYNISPWAIEKAITSKTKAVIAVNLYGLPCDYNKIREKLKGKNISIVEDAAQSVGAKYHDTYSGALGDIAAFSLYATKNIMSGEGGVVTTNNDKFAHDVNLRRQHGMLKSAPYDYKKMGYNYRMSDLQAAVAVAQIGRHQSIRQRRRSIAERYTDSLAGKLPGVYNQIEPQGVESAYHQYAIRLTEKAKVSRDELKARLLEKGIATAIYYPSVLYAIPHIREKSVFAQCKNAEEATKELLCLPIHPALAEDDQWYIIDNIYQLLR